MLTHTGERAYECTYCGKKFGTKHNLIVHINTHTGQFPHGCPHCEKRFPRTKQLRKHMQSHKKEQSLVDAVHNDISGLSDPHSQEDESADHNDLDYSPEGVKDELDYEPPPLEVSSTVMNHRHQTEIQDHSYFSVSCMGSSKPVSSMGKKTQTTTKHTEMPGDKREVHDDPNADDFNQEEIAVQENEGFSKGKPSSVTNTSASRHGNPPNNEVEKGAVAKPVLVPPGLKGADDLYWNARMLEQKNSDTGEKPYVCSHCQRGFTREASLKIHMESHEGLRPHTCLHCGMAFKRLHHYTDHMRIHLGIKPYKCEECGKEFARPAQLKRHSSSHEKQRLRNKNQQHQAREKPSPVIKTNQTSSTLLDRSNIRNPFSPEIRKQAVKSDGGDIHLGDNPVKKVDRTDCKSDEAVNVKTVSIVFHLQNPMNDSATNDSCLDNQGVSTVVKTKDAFMLRQKRPDAGGENRHECPYCSKTFQSASLLKEHINEHISAIPHKCPECGKGYATLSGLRKHCALHSAEKAVTDCNVETTSQGHLETDIDTSTKEAGISDQQGSLEQSTSMRRTGQLGDHVYSATPTISAVHEVKAISAVHEVKSISAVKEVKALNPDLKPNSYKVKEISDKVSRRMNRQLREQVQSETSVSKPDLQIGKIVVLPRSTKRKPFNGKPRERPKRHS